MKRIILVIFAALFMQFAAAQMPDMSQRPKPGPPPVITYTEPVMFKLPNGMTVLVMENHKLPRVTASFTIDAGPRCEGDKAGVSRLMGRMLTEGTSAKNKVQFDLELDQLGADLYLSSNSGQLVALTRNFEKSFYLMAEALRKPAFSPASFEKVKSQALVAIKSSERDSKAVTERVVNALLYGKTHELGEFETSASISSIMLSDIKQAYNNYITPSRCFLTFAGDITPDDAKALVKKAFGNWTGSILQLPTLDNVSNSGTEINIVDMPTAVQSEITLARVINLPLNSPDYHAGMLANQLLGGGADSKLFRNLREKHGFTYGASSRVMGDRFQTLFSANAAVRNEKVDSAVAEFINELKSMVNDPISPEDLQNAKNIYNGAFALDMENPGRSLSFASNILINNLPKDFYSTYLERLNAVTTEDILRVSKKYFDSSSMRIIIVGRQESFVKEIMRLGYPVKYFDGFANPLIR